MKEYKIFAHIKVIITVLIYIFLSIATYFIPFLLSPQWHSWPELLMVVALSFLIAFVWWWFHREAFVRIRINSIGISNSHISFIWEEITDYTVFEVRMDKKSIFKLSPSSKYADMLCIGIGNAVCIERIDIKTCICIALTQRNLLILEEMSGGKSPGINRLLTYYIHDSKRKSSGRFGD